MEEAKNKFGLRYKESGAILGYEVRPGSGKYACVDEIHNLVHDGNNMWLVSDPRHAEWVRLYPTDWYNASYDTPEHHYEPEELEVVSVNISILVEPVKVRIPTPVEFFKKAYKNDPKHLKHLLSLTEDGQEINYTFYEFSQLENVDVEYRGCKY